MAPEPPTGGSARYVFRIEFRLDPAVGGLSVSPGQFETVLYRRADPPGEDGWLFFRDTLWHGELADERYFRDLAGEALGVEVTGASFSELQTDEAYLDALRDAVADQLYEFRADSVDLAISKYLGSSIRVVPELDRGPDSEGRR